MYPLNYAKEKVTLIIKEVRGNEKIKKRCLSQGLIPNAYIEILQNVDSNLRIKTQSSYFIISKVLAQYIMVEEEKII